MIEMVHALTARNNILVSRRAQLRSLDLRRCENRERRKHEAVVALVQSAAVSNPLPAMLAVKTATTTTSS